MNVYSIPCPNYLAVGLACPGIWQIAIDGGLSTYIGRTCSHLIDGVHVELARADAHAAHEGRQVAAGVK